MRILILSASTGGGHNSAAGALREELARREISCDIVDCLTFLSMKTAEFISWGHSYVYKNLPKTFGKAYSFEEKHSGQWMMDAMKLGMPKFRRFLQENPYDAIICVHVFSGMLVTATKKKYGLSVPFYFVSTDYTCSPGANTVEADAFFIPDESLTEEFVSCGIPREKIVSTGIPIRRGFFHPPEKGEARKRLHLPAEGRIALVFSGSIGCGHLDEMAQTLEARLPEDTTVVIICGHNEDAYDSLISLSLKRVVPVGFTTQMDTYMAAADVCLCKPGGLSATEIVAMRLPGVMLLAVPGCETHNYSFLLSKRLVLGAKNWEEATEQLVQLFSDPGILDGLHRRLEEYAVPDGTVAICNRVVCR